MMMIGKQFNEKTGKVEGGHLTFDSGKKIILTAEEFKEFEDKLILTLAENEFMDVIRKRKERELKELINKNYNFMTE